MWKNIFIEACIISLLVFGGFYVNANYLKEKLVPTNGSTTSISPTHISGHIQPQKNVTSPIQHVSGNPTAQKPPNPSKSH